MPQGFFQQLLLATLPPDFKIAKRVSRLLATLKDTTGEKRVSK
jgi:hypothetical protein